MEEKLEPFWSAVAATLGILYALWACSAYYGDGHLGTDNQGAILLILTLPLIFIGTFVSIAYPAGWILYFARSHALRAILALGAVGVFFAGYGKPSAWVFIVAVCCFVLTYRGCRKAQEESEDLERFLGQ